MINYRKYTPLFVFLILAELISVVLTINYFFINNEGGMALAGFISGFIAVITLVLIVIERAIIGINSIDTKTIWIAEIIILLVFFAYFLFHGISFG